MILVTSFAESHPWVNQSSSCVAAGAEVLPRRWSSGSKYFHSKTIFFIGINKEVMYGRIEKGILIKGFGGGKDPQNVLPKCTPMVNLCRILFTGEISP